MTATSRRKPPPDIQIDDAEWVTVAWNGQREKCCGCGLVHKTDHRVIEGGVLQFRSERLEE